MASFTTALEKTLKHEGGYVDDPHDPGGETNLGVTRRAYERYVNRQVTSAEMRALTRGQVHGFYVQNYWAPLGLDDLVDQELADLIFDHNVNTGQNDEGAGTDAGRLLQDAINWVHRREERKRIIVDGLIGPRTVAAANRICYSTGYRDALVERYRSERMKHYMEIFFRLRRAHPDREPSYARYLVSWANRTKAT